MDIKILPFVTAGMDLKVPRLSEMSQSQRNTLGFYSSVESKKQYKGVNKHTDRYRGVQIDDSEGRAIGGLGDKGEGIEK